MKYLIYLLFYLTMFSCAKKLDTVTVVENIRPFTSFDSLFTLDNNITVSNENLDSPVFWYVSSGDKIITCNYNDGNIWIYSKKLWRKLADINIKNGNYIPLKHPLCVAFSKSKMYVADNSNRRIAVFDSNYKQVDSFILVAGHTTPNSIAVANDTIYMGAYNKNDDSYLQKYTLSGGYLGGVMQMNETNSYIPKGWENLNYIRCTTNGHLLYSSELFRYHLFALDIKTMEHKNYLFSNPVYTYLNDSIYKKSENNFEMIRNNFHKTSSLQMIKDNLLVQIEEPYNGNSIDYLKRRNFNLNVFSKNIENAALITNCGNKKLVSSPPDEPYAYFISPYKTTSNTWLIQKYKIN